MRGGGGVGGGCGGVPPHPIGPFPTSQTFAHYPLPPPWKKKHQIFITPLPPPHHHQKLILPY